METLLTFLINFQTLLINIINYHLHLEDAEKLI